MIKTIPFKKVMLIDDSRLDRHIIKSILRKLNFAEEIIEKESAQDALMELEKFSHNPASIPEVIFLDIRMPVLDGFDFLELYNCLPDSVKLKCVIYVLTGSDDLSDEVKATVNKNVKGFFKKPLLNEKALKDILVSKEPAYKI